MKICIAQQNYHIGNFEQNTQKILGAIEAAKNKCQETEKLDPASSECTYDIENLKCNLNSITISELELEEHNNEIEIIAQDIQNLHHIKSLHKTIEKDVRKFRNSISQEVNISDRYNKYLLEKEKELNKEVEKQIYIRKDCVQYRRHHKLLHHTFHQLHQ